MWLFALMAHDGLSNLHPLLWGFPLVLALFYLVVFATHSCYKDFAELKKGLKADEEGQPEDGDGLEASAADGADASSPGDDAPAWFDDADAEAGRAPEEEQDEEEPLEVPIRFSKLPSQRGELEYTKAAATRDAASTLIKVTDVRDAASIAIVGGKL